MSPIPFGPQPTGGSPYNFFHQPYCLADENKLSYNVKLSSNEIVFVQIRDRIFQLLQIWKITGPTEGLAILQADLFLLRKEGKQKH
jgi:hypothetical protein